MHPVFKWGVLGHRQSVTIHNAALFRKLPKGPAINNVMGVVVFIEAHDVCIKVWIL